MPPIRSLRAAFAAAFAFLTFASFAAPASAAVTPNGRLQIFHLDVAQGDGALIITPGGQVVMIDDGVSTSTTAMGKSVVQQLQALGVTHVDHHFASHYHADHIGNMTKISNAGITFGYGWDRGSSYPGATYTSYATILGANRRTLAKGQVITLDSLSAHPVTIKCIDLAGMGTSTTDENALCLMLKVSYGEFDETFGGDLPGLSPQPLIEDNCAPQIGRAEAYKVHHHGSATSSNANILAAIQPQVGIISCGNGNSYGHPTASALSRLHAANVKTYWTELGTGVAPVAGTDYVASGQVYISATWEPAGVDTIRNINSTGGNTFVHTFLNSGTPVGDAIAPLATLTSPDGGETWKIGSSHAITWNATDNVAVTSVDLAFSIDSGVNWSNIATGLGNTGSYSWTVPAPGTNQARVRVRARDAANNLAADSSIANVTFDWWQIVASNATGGTISPNGTVNAAEGASSSFTIAPSGGFAVANVLVDGVGVGAVTNYQFTNVAANHTIVPSFADVQAPTVAVTAPAGGESWAAASTHDVTWNASDNAGVDSVTIAYSAHGFVGPWIRVAGGLPNSGTYAWTLPSVQSDSAVVRVTAYDAAHLSGFDVSNNLFAISLGTADVNDGALAFALASPTPNPSAGNTRLSFTLPREGHARLEVLDLSGRRLWAIEGVFSAGRYSTEWNGRTSDGSTVGAGLYFVRLSTPFGTRTDRLARLH